MDSPSNFYFDAFVYLLAILVVAITYNWMTTNASGSKPKKSTNEIVKPTGPPPDPNRIFTLEELKEYDGHDPSKPLYLGCIGKVYDVSAGSGFYGPGGPYSAFAGRDASKMLATMSTEYAGANIDNLSPYERQTLRDWAERFEMKYPIAGKIVDFSEPNSGPKPSEGQPSDSALAS